MLPSSTKWRWCWRYVEHGHYMARKIIRPKKREVSINNNNSNNNENNETHNYFDTIGGRIWPMGGSIVSLCQIQFENSKWLYTLHTMGIIINTETRTGCSGNAACLFGPRCSTSLFISMKHTTYANENSVYFSLIKKNKRKCNRSLAHIHLISLSRSICDVRPWNNCHFRRHRRRRRRRHQFVLHVLVAAAAAADRPTMVAAAGSGWNRVNWMWSTVLHNNNWISTKISRKSIQLRKLYIAFGEVKGWSGAWVLESKKERTRQQLLCKMVKWCSIESNVNE